MHSGSDIPQMVRVRHDLSNGGRLRFEIERSFLVRNDGWRSRATSSARLRDGVLRQDARGKLRVRTDGSRAWLCLKGPRDGITRTERKVEISLVRRVPLVKSIGWHLGATALPMDARGRRRIRRSPP